MSYLKAWITTREFAKTLKRNNAGIAQLEERNVANVEVVGSWPTTRTKAPSSSQVRNLASHASNTGSNPVGVTTQGCSVVTDKMPSRPTW